MRTWLRGWFAWRFSLRRLVIATVFLGAVVGLNLSRVGPLPGKYYAQPGGSTVAYSWGWPFPTLQKTQLSKDLGLDPTWAAWRHLQQDSDLPWTHLSYRLLSWPSLAWLDSGSGLIVCGLINVIFALTMPFLILFLQIPRRPKKAKA